MAQSNTSKLICDLLLESPNPLKVRNIASRLKISPIEVHKILLDLQLDSRAKLINGYEWQAEKITSPKFNDIRDNTDKPSSVKYDIPSNNHQDSRWFLFRQLCKYYVECLKIQENHKVALYLDKLEQDGVMVSGKYDLRAISAGEPFAMKNSPQIATFLKRALGPNSRTCFLGLPIYFSTFRSKGEVYKVLYPIFVLRLEVEYDKEENIVLFRPKDQVDVNYEWLDRMFKSPSDKEVFLEICGFSEEGDNYIPDFVSLYQKLADFYNDWWQDAPNINALHTVNFNKCKNTGIYNAMLLLNTKALRYNANLIRELEYIAEEANDEQLDKTALKELFQYSSMSDKPNNDKENNVKEGENKSSFVTEFDHLNKEQKKACGIADNMDLTVISGPPGTGKSRVVAHIMANFALNKKSVLFASRNHQAIEAVIPKLNALTEPNVLAIRLNQPSNVISSNSFAQVLETLSNQNSSFIANKYERSFLELSELLDKRENVQNSLIALSKIRQQILVLCSENSDLLSSYPDNYSELIWTFKQSFDLQTILSVINFLAKKPTGVLNKLLFKLRSFWKRKKIQQSSQALCGVCRHFTGNNSKTDNSDKKLLSQLKHFEPLMKSIVNVPQIKKLKEESAIYKDIEVTYEIISEINLKVISKTRDLLVLLASSYGANLSGEERERFSEMYAALANHGDNISSYDKKLAKKIYERFGMLLKHVPLWAVTNLSVKRYIPLLSSIFNTVIIDEASQCDIASAIPLLYRSQKAVIVGDIKQLSHVSKMKRLADKQLRQKYGLTDIQFERFTYQNSLFNVAQTSRKCNIHQNFIKLLDHHRCSPSIATYFNRVFYNNELRIMTTDLGHQELIWTDVESDVESATRGCISNNQIDAIVQELCRLNSEGFKGSVGVVTPFAIQADRIRDKVEKTFNMNIPICWNFHVDTADGFQGDERDIILLSLVGGELMPKGSRWFLANSPNRFNVAVSRARKVLHIFGDKQWCLGCGIDHIVELVKSVENNPPETFQFRKDLIGPVWEPLLAEKLTGAGLSFKQQYPACGKYLDFAMIREGLKLNIEVDGEAFHRAEDGTRRFEDIERDQELIACRWKIKRFWVYELRDNIGRCVDEIVDIWAHY